MSAAHEAALVVDGYIDYCHRTGRSLTGAGVLRVLDESGYYIPEAVSEALRLRAEVKRLLTRTVRHATAAERDVAMSVDEGEAAHWARQAADYQYIAQDLMDILGQDGDEE